MVIDAWAESARREPERIGIQGFTLLEALVAMVLSTVIVSLVTSTFLAQNRFYTDAMNRAGIQESVRGAMSRASSDLHAVFRGGIVSGDPTSVVFRLPILVAGVCAVDDQKTFAFLPMDAAHRSLLAATGYGLRAGKADWRYEPASWSSVYHSSGESAAEACARSGADTVGAVSAFARLDGLAPSGTLLPGDLVTVYEDVELKIAPSKLRPGTRALFRGPVGDVLAEVATGLSGASRFEYGRTGRTGFRSRVSGKGNLARIDRVRIYLEGSAPASSGGRDDLTFELTQTVPLRNAN
ncbi:MAG: hypothetical protein HKO65_18750 [Gemmatimonadetes bacterium]|nr:hypothetical protein [Gemmatimonadota bacterium]